ncbi:hypothetical protein PAXRUDRAFT_535895 [Paxillus rubicundulus Ve08.2h10]|uniref:Uncharacterized protein n=1 Tax=Paxillus rubicundulus Ve08.2h10 TaxID=930991 RepID=A0A0D0DUY0_9AGAM|nr:hypothetical protein PAXRUDRAFT_535895 [Paxillus rubicundulus Ve08.2h10]
MPVPANYSTFSSLSQSPPGSLPILIAYSDRYQTFLALLHPLFSCAKPSEPGRFVEISMTVHQCITTRLTCLARL